MPSAVNIVAVVRRPKSAVATFHTVACLGMPWKGLGWRGRKGTERYVRAWDGIGRAPLLSLVRAVSAEEVEARGLDGAVLDELAQRVVGEAVLPRGVVHDCRAVGLPA